VTNEMTYAAPDGRRLDFYNVYIPSPPNPTAGFLSLIPKDEAVILNLTIEEGLNWSCPPASFVPGELTGRSPTESEPPLGTTATS